MASSELGELTYLTTRLGETAGKLSSALTGTREASHSEYGRIFACRDLVYYLQNSVASAKTGAWQLSWALEGRLEGDTDAALQLMATPVYHALIQADNSFEIVAQTMAINAYDSAARELRARLEATVEALYIERKLERKTFRERIETITQIPDDRRRFGEMLGALEVEQEALIGSLYGELSRFIHPNYADFVDGVVNRPEVLGQPHAYDEELLRNIANLCVQMTSCIVHLVFHWCPEAEANFRRKTKVRKLLNILGPTFL